MSDPNDEVILDLRWMCFRCGRFVAHDAIHEKDHYDHRAWFGVVTETTYECSRCGTIQGEPWLVPIGVARSVS